METEADAVQDWEIVEEDVAVGDVVSSVRVAEDVPEYVAAVIEGTELTVSEPVSVELKVPVLLPVGVSVSCDLVAVAEAVSDLCVAEPVPLALAVTVGHALGVASVEPERVAPVDGEEDAEADSRVPVAVAELLAVAVAVVDSVADTLAEKRGEGVVSGVVGARSPVPLAEASLEGVAEAHGEGKAEAVAAHVAQEVPEVDALARALRDADTLGVPRGLTEGVLLAAGEAELEAQSVLDAVAVAVPDAEPVADSV